MTSALRAIPTNIITGFLGVGKTTAIQQLLRAKPAGQRWAVLVNEFGEVGIDGRLLSGGDAEADVFIREVPGGCMCCANGLPVQIALNRLLATARPQRLLIEPTGLGHPREIIALLRSDLYRATLDLRATLTLVDARHLGDERYAGNSIFQQQMQVADIVIGNKGDACSAQDRERLSLFLQAVSPGKPLYFTEWGKIDAALLDTENSQPTDAAHDYAAASPLSVDWPETLPSCGYLHKSRAADGYYSSGWIFSPEFVFDHQQVFTLLCGAPEQRLKAVLITDQGVYAFNKTGAVLTETELDDTADSRIEFIHTEPVDDRLWLSRLLASSQRMP